MGTIPSGRAAAALGAAVAALAAGGGTYALASTSSSRLSACVHRKGGALYEATKCARHDRKLTWGVVGPQGPVGPAGPTGKAGSNGSNGTNGTDGTNGVGATTSAVALTAGDNDTIAALGSTAALNATCGTGTNSVHFVVFFDADETWQLDGSYSTYQLQANGTAVVANGSATSPIGTYAIADDGPEGQGTILYTVIPTSTPGLLTGSMHVTLGGGVSPSDYDVSFDVEIEPSATNVCQGEVTVTPST
jgi:hypothetical protein